MGMFGRAICGAKAGAVAAAGVALSFFVLDLIQFQPLATAGALSGAAFGPTVGVELDLASASGVIAGLATAFRIATFTVVHFLMFSLVGISASLIFDWRQPVGLRPVLVVAALCAAAFSGTIAMSGSVVALEYLGPSALIAASFLAGVLLCGYLRLAAMPEPEETPTD